MHFHIVTLFPEIYDSFLKTSLINKAIEKGVLSFSFTNPRKFCLDRHQQVDDEIYGGGAGMLMKAKPVIDSIEEIIQANNLKTSGKNWKIVFMSPSKMVFNQEIAYQYAGAVSHMIIVNGRYE